MSGRPVHLLAAAAIAAAASLLLGLRLRPPAATAAAVYSYQAPVAYYTAPVVYRYSYAAPVAARRRAVLRLRLRLCATRRRCTW